VNEVCTAISSGLSIQEVALLIAQGAHNGLDAAMQFATQQAASCQYLLAR
jgi:hypothetical protein